MPGNLRTVPENIAKKVEAKDSIQSAVESATAACGAGMNNQVIIACGSLSYHGRSESGLWKKIENRKERIRMIDHEAMEEAENHLQKPKLSKQEEPKRIQSGRYS